MLNKRTQSLVEAIGGTISIVASLIVILSLIFSGKWGTLVVVVLAALFLGPILREALGVILNKEFTQIENSKNPVTTAKRLSTRLMIKVTLTQLVYGLAAMYVIANLIKPETYLLAVALSAFLFGVPWIAMATQESKDSSSWSNAYLFGIVGLLTGVVQFAFHFMAGVITLIMLMAALFVIYRSAAKQRVVI